MRHLTTIVLWTLFGAVTTALAAFLYFAWILIQQGVRRDSIPIERLLFDTMGLDRYAFYGAAGGLVIGVLVVMVIALTSKRDAQPNAMDAMADPDTLIKMRRAKLADNYLASRKVSTR